MQELLPCPFCGGRAEFEYEDWNEETGDGDDGTGVVSCTECHTRTVRNDRDSVEAIWNTRV